MSRGSARSNTKQLDHIEQLKIRRQIEKDARSIIHDDNENPEDYEIDRDRLSLSADGTKQKYKIFPKSSDNNDVNYESDDEKSTKKREKSRYDLSHIDPTWNMKDRGYIVPKPSSKEDLDGLTIFDHARHVNEDDKDVERYVDKYGHIDPESSEAKEFIDKQVRLEQRASKRGGKSASASDTVKLQMKWKAQLHMAHVMNKHRQKEREDSAAFDNKTDAEIEKEAYQDSIWSAGPPLPMSVIKQQQKDELRKQRSVTKSTPKMGPFFSPERDNVHKDRHDRKKTRKDADDAHSKSNDTEDDHTERDKRVRTKSDHTDRDTTTTRKKRKHSTTHDDHHHKRKHSTIESVPLKKRKHTTSKDNQSTSTNPSKSNHQSTSTHHSTTQSTSTDHTIHTNESIKPLQSADALKTMFNISEPELKVRKRHR